VDLGSTSTQAIPPASQSVIHRTAPVSRSRGYSSHFQEVQIKTTRPNQAASTYELGGPGGGVFHFYLLLSLTLESSDADHTLSTGKVSTTPTSFRFVSTLPGARDTEAPKNLYSGGHRPPRKKTYD
jgi:hypothetical protein